MQIQFDCFYMSVSHAFKAKYGSSHPIQIKFVSLMHQTIVYVCAKFHKNRFNSEKVMAVSCPYITMFVDFEILGLMEHGSTRGGRRQRRDELTGAGGTLAGVSSPHSAFSKVAGKSFSVFNRFEPNLVCLLAVPEEDRPPILKKIRQL